MEERISIKDSLRALRKYGSTSTNSYNNVVPSHCLRHIVVQNDTLQGIALKYGVSTEQIRRLNKLWTNDSLFLRESLLIPVKNHNGACTSAPTTPFYESSGQELDTFVNETPNENDNHRNGLPSSRDKGDEFNDFLSRIDSDIASKTKKINMSRDKSIFAPELGNTSSYSSKRAMSRLKQQQQRQRDEGDGVANDLPSVILQDKRVKNGGPRLIGPQNGDDLVEL